MATKKTARNSKSSGVIAKNPLFKALNGNTAPKSSLSKSSSSSKASKKTRSIKTNELAVRLGLVKDVTKNKRTSSTKMNPLAAALSNKPRSSIDTKKEELKSKKVAKLRDKKKGKEINFKKVKKNALTVESQRVPSKNNLSSQPPYQTDYAVPYGVNNNAPKQNYTHTAYHALEQEKFERSSNRQRNTRSRDNDISFRNASLIPFLRITNLEPDVTETDIRSVLTEKLGPTLKILKRDVLYENQPAVCAEVFFLKENYLPQYAAALNNIHADGRLLKAEVATKSDIIHSDKLWEGMLREVRFLKQEALSK